MMRATRAAFSPLSHLISILLSYALFVSTLAPFAVRRADAAPSIKKHSSSADAAKPATEQSAPPSDAFDGKLRDEMAAPEVNALDTARRAHQTPALSGESTPEKIGLSAGHTPQSLVADLRSHLAVNSTKPQFLAALNETTASDPRLAEPWALKNASAGGTQTTMPAPISPQAMPTPRVGYTGRPSPPFPSPQQIGSRASQFMASAPPRPPIAARPNLPNLSLLHRLPSFIPQPPRLTIDSTEEDKPKKNEPQNPSEPLCEECDLPCVDCEPGGGGGGGGGRPAPPSDQRYSPARTYLENETGEPSVDLGSRNFNWGLPILGLSGRSGLDLNLALTYNSLVWTKQLLTPNPGTGIRYNADRGFPGPGFRLGFPMIHPRYTNSQVGTLVLCNFSFCK